MVSLCKYSKNQRHTQILRSVFPDLSNSFPSIYIPGCQCLFPINLKCREIQFSGHTDKHFRTDHSPKSPNNSFSPLSDTKNIRTAHFFISRIFKIRHSHSLNPSIAIIIIQELTSFRLTSVDVQESVNPSQQDMSA